MKSTIVKFLFSTFIFLSLASVSNAQSAQKDSISLSAKHRANRAALFSAVVPGLGQAYNKKYWKLPILYAGFGTLYYFISTNNTEFKKYKSALILRNDNDSTTIDQFPRFSDADLTVRKDFTEETVICVIFLPVSYTLNIIDAYVDSQLMDFDISDDLSMHTAPTLFQAPEEICRQACN
ncbi:MAG: hypothetical protein IPP27_17400 [Bacteroidetes bacterium]|nr:hypothetical protein [Bacteroidota bacterium]